MTYSEATPGSQEKCKMGLPLVTIALPPLPSASAAMSAPTNDEQSLLQLTQQLLSAIASRDWATYQQLTDPSLTCFEPEACGHLVRGLPFHQFYFQLSGGSRPGNTTLVEPHVRLIGDVAVVSYVRLIQAAGDDGPRTTAYEETRVWHRQQGIWKHVHFHRSRAGGTRPAT